MKTSGCIFRRGGVFVSLAVIVLQAWHSCCAGGADSPFLQRVWQTDQGLPHNSVHAILQTRDGYLWVGTRSGVARFDGARFTIPEDMPEITSGSISSLCEDRDGGLWIGTEEGVACLQDGKNRLYRQVEGLAGDNVRTVYEGKEGVIWIGTSTGLSQFKNGVFRNFTRNEGLPHNVVRSVCEDDLGDVWIATDGGLCLLKDGTISIPKMAGELDKTGRSLCLDGERNLWAGTMIGLYRRTTNGWDSFDKNRGLSDNFISTMYSDRSGRLWVGTYGGLNWRVNGEFHTELTSEGTPYDLVNDICEDREGTIWIGSKEGLARLKTRPFTAVAKQQGLTYNNVMSILEDKTGTYWCGTWGGGLFQLKDRGIAGFAVSNTFANSRVLSLCDGRDGSLWIGMDFGEGLYRLKDGEVTHYGESNRLERVGIRVVCEDRAGNLWAGTSVLNLFKDGAFIHYTKEDGLAGGIVRVIMEDGEGSLWVGSGNGLSRRRDGKFTCFTTKDGLSRNTVLALYEDKENNLWIGTQGGGLNRLRDGRFTAYTTRDGLFNNDVLEILEDDHGFLWMSCLKGVFCVRKQALDRFDRREIGTIPCASYGKDDGMISAICGNVSKPAAWKARDGRLWFATTKGLAVADPNIQADNPPPPVVIEEFLADQQTVIDPFSRPVLSRKVRQSSGPPLIIAPGRGEWEIHYTALSFRAPEKNRFKYKLEGVDPDWVDAGTRRVAYYNNIGPGGYRFRVLACDNDGVWNEKGAELSITLLPHFWQTWWFAALCLLAGVATVGGTARFITQKRMLRRLERLEQHHALEKERNRIAKDMHDQLGACLTQVGLLGEMTKKDAGKIEETRLHAGKICDTARELGQALDEIVWAVNPKNDNLNRLAAYVAIYAEEFFQMADVRCRVDVPQNLPAHPLSAETRHSLFLAIKEALNNAVKHAGASEVWIRFSLQQAVFQISIEDNGRGFSLEAGSPFGNGVSNMKKRLEDMGGRCEIGSRLKEGTKITFTLPIPDSAAD